MKKKVIVIAVIVGVISIGIFSIYQYIYRIKPTDVIIPKSHLETNLLLIEDINLNLNQYEKKVILNMPPIYEDIPVSIKPEIKKYLEKRNALIHEFANKYVIESGSSSENSVKEPFQDIEIVHQILPISTKLGDEIILIARSHESFWSRYFLLDSNYKILDQASSHNYWGTSFVSVNFLDRLWTETCNPGGSGGSIFYDTLRITDDKIKLESTLIASISEFDEGFDQYKIVDSTTNPTLKLYKKHFPSFVFIFILPFVLFFSILLMLLYLIKLLGIHIFTFIKNRRRK
jgi:hypothetical protein